MNRSNCVRMTWILAAVLLLCACTTGGTTVFVQSVESLSALGGIAPGDRFGGMVVSENVTEIQKDADKAVSEIFVKAGDDVTEGQELFSYDTAQLSLSVDKKKLERDQLKGSIESYKEQIEELTEDAEDAKGSDKLQYTIQIQTIEIDLKEAELNLEATEREVAQLEEMLTNTAVLSPVTGRVTAVNESGFDAYGNPLPFLTIQRQGSYRIKGTLNELQRGSITEGMRMKIISRVDESMVWYGTVTVVDYESPSQGSENDMYIGMMPDEMGTSTKYPFYVEPDAYDGLLLGQHVYMELDVPEESTSGLSISISFLCYDEDGTPYVWAENRGRLEKRAVTVGAENWENGTVEILDGLTLRDYIAFPDETVCAAGAQTTRVQPPTEEEGVES